MLSLIDNTIMHMIISVYNYYIGEREICNRLIYLVRNCVACYEKLYVH